MKNLKLGMCALIVSTLCVPELGAMDGDERLTGAKRKESELPSGVRWPFSYYDKKLLDAAVVGNVETIRMALENCANINRGFKRAAK